MPAWNESFEFAVTRSHFTSSQQLRAEVFDYDMLSDDDAIGEVSLQVLGGGPRLTQEENWIPLRGGSVKKGEINIWWCYKGLKSTIGSPSRSLVCKQAVQVLDPLLSPYIGY